MILGSTTLSAHHYLDYLHTRHRLTTTPLKPPSLYEPEKLWVELMPLFTDGFPLRSVVQTHVMGALTEEKLLSY